LQSDSVTGLLQSGYGTTAGLPEWKTNPTAGFLRYPMIIAERNLRTNTSSNSSETIQVRLFAPIENNQDWSCNYEILWPSGKRTQKIHGIDSMQALVLAMHMIGSDLYASKYHENGTLVFDKPGNGYGFPVANIARDALIGDDKRFFG
jgi:hypothetical protein